MDELNIPIRRMGRDLREAARTLGPDEARFLVDSYYQMQRDRIRSGHQMSTLAKEGEPASVLEWLAEQSHMLENQIKGALDQYSAAHPAGVWARSNIGVGPVIAAGLLAHIDIEKAPVAGHIWNFAGINPGVVWKKGEKRPWNANLKTLCFKLGESFVKFQNHEDCYYGRLFKERKASEWEGNLAGKYSDIARKCLEAKNYGKTTEAYKWYSGTFGSADFRKSGAVNVVGIPAEPGIPMLPPAHIHARARRWVVKLFLCHFHRIWFHAVKGYEPPAPYAFAHLKHVHRLIPPDWPLSTEPFV